MRIGFLDAVHPALKEGLTALGHQCVDMTSCSLSTIEGECHQLEGIVIRSRFPLDATFLSKLKQLQFIARAGSGTENIATDYCKKRGIRVLNAPEGNRNAVAEHALGMLLSLFNRLTIADAEVRNGQWNRAENRGVELDGKTVGIIGYGHTGTAFAQKLSGFQVERLAYDKYKHHFGDSRGVEEVSLATIQQKADIVSIHIPQNSETTGLINADFIRRMHRPFYLINTSRGKIIATEALLEGLNSGKVLGACLDVLEYEKSSFEEMTDTVENTPLKTLLSLKNVVFSPHIAGWTHESHHKISTVLLDKVTHYLNQ